MASIAIVALGGCTTKGRARAQAQEAYIAGQQQAMAQWQLLQPGNAITVVGDVRQSTVEWSEGLSLAQAILQAEYQGARDPREIVIIRRGQRIPVNVRQLLRGHDHLLEPGDRIEIQ